MTETQTEAQRIAALLHNDGTCWGADDGRTLDELTTCATTEERRPEGTDTVYRRHVFADGSAVLVADPYWWDLEGFSPWRCAGHEEDGELGVGDA